MLNKKIVQKNRNKFNHQKCQNLHKETLTINYHQDQTLDNNMDTEAIYLIKIVREVIQEKNHTRK